MRAVVCTEWGGPEELTLKDVPDLVPKTDDVLIDVHACSVNFADILMIQGKYQTKPNLPFVPGLEAAGTVVRAPENSGLTENARVVAFLWNGGFAQRTVAAVEETFVLPDHMSFETAAAFLSAYASTDLALRDVGRLAAGETLLVLGASGGVGLAAVEIGKAVGAVVIAAASSPEKLESAKQKGADFVVCYAEEDWTSKVMEMTGGRGVEICLDPVGGDLFGRALSAVGWGGRIVLVGFASGAIPQIPANRLLVKHRSALGSSLRYYRRYNPDALRASMDQLFQWYEQGRISPLISERLPLEETAKGLRRLADRQAIGKVVIRVRS